MALTNIKKIELQRGDEVGRFKMGSTAIVLFGKDQIDWLEHWQAGHSIKMGEALGQVHQSSQSEPQQKETETSSDQV